MSNRDARAFKARIASLAELHDYQSPKPNHAQVIVPERWLPPRGAFSSSKRPFMPWVLLAFGSFTCRIVTIDGQMGMVLVLLLAYVTALWLWAKI